MSPPISQALTADLLQGAIGALLVIPVQRRAVVVAEVKFREVAVQMLFGAMLIDALHAALEDAEIAFNRVGVDGAAHVLIA